MLQIQLLREDAIGVKRKLEKKHFFDTHIIDLIISLDNERKKCQLELDIAKSNLNSLSKEIGILKKQGKEKEADKVKVSVASYSRQIEVLGPTLTKLENELHEKLVQLPNLPSEKVPLGKSSEENEVVKESNNIVSLNPGALPHWDLIKKYDIVDFDTGAKITGRGFPLYKGEGAKLQRALIHYFLEFNTAAGYTEYLPPLMVNKATAYGTGQLPDKEGQMYYMEEDKFYLIPTSEVPVTNIYRDEIVREENLPIKMTAFSSCFRREAGSFGKDVRGLNRVHQFEKVEIVQLVHPDKSYEVLEEMVAHVEKLLIALRLPYRIVKLCGGDLGFASALTFDFEVYSAAQKKWLEVSSVSNFETFQTNRMKIKFRDKEGKTRLLHSLNGSALALPRILACILENNQRQNIIELPKVLNKYFGNYFISLKKSSTSDLELNHFLSYLFLSRELTNYSSRQNHAYKIGKWFSRLILNGEKISIKKRGDFKIGQYVTKVKSIYKRDAEDNTSVLIDDNFINGIDEIVIIVFEENFNLKYFFQVPRRELTRLRKGNLITFQLLDTFNKIGKSYSSIIENNFSFSDSK